MIKAEYTVECEKCGKLLSRQYDEVGRDFNRLETAKDFIDDFNYSLMVVGGDIKLLCAKCAKGKI
jgi:hypothetical protein